MHVPTFSKWLEGEDQTASYETMRDLLKLLQWQCRGKMWILKTPHHLEWLDFLFQVFPDAKLVMTHRDPVSAFASFSSMLYSSGKIFSDSITPETQARHWFHKVQRMLSRMMNFRENNNITIHDVRKPRDKKELKVFNGSISRVACPRIAVR